MRWTDRLYATVLLAAACSWFAGCGGGGGGGSQVRTEAAGPVDYLAWVEHPGNPVLNPGASTYYPCVLLEGGAYKMWVMSGAMRLFTSADGLSWGAGVPCTGLPSGAYHAQVIHNPDTGNYEMWYWTLTIYAITGIGHAVSTDGINWTGAGVCAQLPAPNRLITGSGLTRGTYGPCQVFYNPSGLSVIDPENPFANKYVMYYDQTDGGRETIGLAASADGVLWGVASALEGKQVLGLGASGAWDGTYATFCAVFQDGGEYRMFYSGGRTRGHEGIGYAHSPDGISWTKHPTPIFSISDGVAWRSSRTYTPSIVLTGSEARMYFTGEGSLGRGIGLATLPMAPPDTTPPTITLSPAAPAVLWPPNHKATDVLVTGSITDGESGVQTATLAVTDEYGEVSQSLDLTGSLGPDGSFSATVSLIAWRNGNDRDGRTYTITVSATDQAGNASPDATTTVCCPHDQRAK